MTHRQESGHTRGNRKSGFPVRTFLIIALVLLFSASVHAVPSFHAILEPHLLILPPAIKSPDKVSEKPATAKEKSGAALLKDITKQLLPKTVVIPKELPAEKIKASPAKTKVSTVVKPPAVLSKTMTTEVAEKLPDVQKEITTATPDKDAKTSGVNNKEKSPEETTETSEVKSSTDFPVTVSGDLKDVKPGVEIKPSSDVKTNELEIAQITPKDVPVPVTFLPAEEKREIQLVVGESKVISAFALVRTAVGNPAVADVVVVSNHELLINGKTPGTTTLTLWDKRGRMTYIITVYKEPLSTQTKIFPLQYLWLKQYTVERESNKISWKISQNSVLMNEIDKTLSLVIGKDSYSINSELNNIVIQGTDKDLEKAESVISKIDIPETQILVEAKVMEVSEDDLKNIGITWNINKEKVAVQYDTTGGQFKIDTLGALSEQYVVKLNSLQDTGKANLLANPKIGTVLHADPGRVFLGDSIPITTVTKDASGNTLQNVSYVDIGVDLFFLPTKVSDDGYVTMFVLTSVSTVSGFNTSGQPSLKGNAVRSEVRIKDGEAVVIGGLLRSEDVESMQKVPYLADLPFLGNFFKNKKKTSKKNEMIIIFTPHILRGTETTPASAMTPAEPK